MWTVRLIQAIVLLYTRILVVQNLMHRWHQVYQAPTQKHAEKAGGHLPSGLQTVKKVRNRQNRFTFLRKLAAGLQYK